MHKKLEENNNLVEKEKYTFQKGQCSIGIFWTLKAFQEFRLQNQDEMGTAC